MADPDRMYVHFSKRGWRKASCWICESLVAVQDREAHAVYHVKLRGFTPNDRTSTRKTFSFVTLTKRSTGDLDTTVTGWLSNDPGPR